MRLNRPLSLYLPLLLLLSAQQQLLTVAHPTRLWGGSRFVLASQPKLGRVVFSRVSEVGGVTKWDKVQELVANGLQTPQGIAVHQPTARLYVADPAARKILQYTLIETVDHLLTVDAAYLVVVSDVEPRWVAVDGSGSLVFSEEASQRIMKFTAGVDTHPVVLYDGTNVTSVKSPGGVAVDATHTFWANKFAGTEYGSVVRGGSLVAELHSQNGQIVTTEGGALTPHALALNSDKVYGVCLAHSNVYFTDESTALFAVKKSGGAVATISSKFLAPRGCAYDGDGTVYVADKNLNGVYCFAGNMGGLAPQTVTKAFDCEGAFGLATVEMSFALAKQASAVVVSVLILVSLIF